MTCALAYVTACALAITASAHATEMHPVVVDDIDGDELADLVVATEAIDRPLAAFSSRDDRVLWTFAPSIECARGMPVVVACADRDGDGMRDLAAAWPVRATSAFPEHVLVTIVSGRTGCIVSDVRVATDAATSASCLVEVGDLDGDTRADLLLGIPGNGFEVGVVHALSGSHPNARDFARGDERCGRFGRAMARVGDVDHDGFEDIAIGEPGPQYARDSTDETRFVWRLDSRSSNGSVVIVSGRTGRPLRRILGHEVGPVDHWMSWTVGETFAAARTDEGAALSDLWLLAPDLASKRGVAVLVRARTGVVLARIRVLDDAWDMHKTKVSCADDWDGDGAGDVLVMTWDWLRHRKRSIEHRVGRVRVVGRDGVLATWEGRGERACLGWDAATCPDRDEDGRPDAWILRTGQHGDLVVGLHASRTGTELRSFDPLALPAAPESR